MLLLEDTLPTTGGGGKKTRQCYREDQQGFLYWDEEVLSTERRVYGPGGVPGPQEVGWGEGV